MSRIAKGRVTKKQQPKFLQQVKDEYEKRRSVIEQMPDWAKTYLENEIKYILRLIEERAYRFQIESQCSHWGMRYRELSAPGCTLKYIKSDDQGNASFYYYQPSERELKS